MISANGRPAVKLSDNALKAMGPPQEVERYQRVFGAAMQASLPSPSNGPARRQPLPPGGCKVARSGAIGRRRGRSRAPAAGSKPVTMALSHALPVTRCEPPRHYGDRAFAAMSSPSFRQ